MSRRDRTDVRIHTWVETGRERKLVFVLFFWGGGLSSNRGSSKTYLGTKGASMTRVVEELAEDCWRGRHHDRDGGIDVMRQKYIERREALVLKAANTSIYTYIYKHNL